MKLAVIGDTQHYRDDDGRLCALEPVVNQLDRWGELFDEVVLCAPIDPGPPPRGFAPYRNDRISLVPLPRAGGNDVRSKLGLARFVAPWFTTTRRVAKSADVVHLRTPCNIALVALFSTRGVARRHAMYAGAWRGYRGEPAFFGLQRRLLRSPSFGGPVSMYGPADPQRPHLYPFFSPSFSAAAWDAASAEAAAQSVRIASAPTDTTWRLVTVGRLSVNKNQQAIVRAVAILAERGVHCSLVVVGDGPQRAALAELAASLGVSSRVDFAGSVDHDDVMSALAHADFSVLATRQEGYGKVLPESMVFGTVPVFGESPVSDDLAGRGQRGVVVDVERPETIADAVAGLVADRTRWAAMSAAARAYAGTVTLEAFGAHVSAMLLDAWPDIELRTGPASNAGRP